MRLIKNWISNPFSTRLCLLVSCMLIQGVAGAGETVSLLPVPLHLQYGEGEYAIPETIDIAVPDDASLKDNADWFAGLITQRSVHVSTGATEGAAINVERISQSELQTRFEKAKLVPMTGLSEAYFLEVKADGVLIQAADNAGMFYGLGSLWQLLNQHSGPGGKLPVLKILDAPEFEWRGLMLDSARHMQSTKFIRQYIDWMSLHKLNVFHWHLTDDQAWRLEIRAYPKLTEVGAYRVPAGAAPAADIDPATGEARLYGGFYTQEEVREIVAYAASRHITVVPEIDVPGHASAAIVAYPELGVPGFQLQRVPASWGIYDNVFNLEESTLVFLEMVLAEVVDLFPGEFIHLGGDEVVTKQWEASERVAERMRELEIDSYQSLQNYYVERLQAGMRSWKAACHQKLLSCPGGVSRAPSKRRPRDTRLCCPLPQPFTWITSRQLTSMRHRGAWISSRYVISMNLTPYRTRWGTTASCCSACRVISGRNMSAWRSVRPI